MSNEPKKKNTTRLVIIAVVIVVVIVGAFAYQMMNAAPATATTMMTSAASAPLATMTSVTMTSSTMTSANSQAAQPVTLLGAGATFPAPLIQKWTVEYNKLNPSVTINYNPIGSGGGIQQITAKTVDFGASDAPLSDSQLGNTTGLVLMPETLGGVAITYNLVQSGISNSTVLRFTGDVIARIYMGQIITWNDPAIQALNPSVNLPNVPIAAVHRSDGSGTTYAFTDYLSTVNSNWNSAVGHSTTVTWPADKIANGIGASGNAGVAGAVVNTPGAIGYVDVIYALSNHLGIGAVKNAAGNFIVPTLDTILKAAQAATGNPSASDLRMHIVNANGNQSYPIATYTYLLIYKDMSLQPSMNKAKAQALAQFLWWAVHDGQTYSPALVYVPLPANIVSADEQLLKSLTFQGQQLITT